MDDLIQSILDLVSALESSGGRATPPLRTLADQLRMGVLGRYGAAETNPTLDEFGEVSERTGLELHYLTLVENALTSVVEADRQLTTEDMASLRNALDALRAKEDSNGARPKATIRGDADVIAATFDSLAEGLERWVDSVIDTRVHGDVGHSYEQALSEAVEPFLAETVAYLEILVSQEYSLGWQEAFEDLLGLARDHQNRLRELSEQNRANYLELQTRFLERFCDPDGFADADDLNEWFEPRWDSLVKAGDDQLVDSSLRIRATMEPLESYEDFVEAYCYLVVTWAFGHHKEAEKLRLGGRKLARHVRAVGVAVAAKLYPPSPPSMSAMATSRPMGQSVAKEYEEWHKLDLTQRAQTLSGAHKTVSGGRGRTHGRQAGREATNELTVTQRQILLAHQEAEEKGQNPPTYRALADRLKRSRTTIMRWCKEIERITGALLPGRDRDKHRRESPVPPGDLDKRPAKKQ